MNFIKIDILPFVSTDTSEEQIQIVSLNRPAVKNAFHPEMIQELTDYFHHISTQDKICMVVLKGEGGVFCAGADLNWMQKMVNFNYEENLQDSEKLWDMFASIQKCEVPVVGYVQGAAYGGALGLIACCDYVVTDEKTQFCFSEAKLGLVPAVISGFILQKVADAFVRPLMISAEVFQASKALEIGLVHDIKNLAQVTLVDYLKKFTANGPIAMKETKKLLNKLRQPMDWQEQKQLTTQVISQRRMSLEGQERLKKFIEKK